MNRLNMTALLLAGLLATASAWAHDPRLHKANAVTGEITSVGANSFELKTKSETIKVTFSNTTKFEHGKEVVDKSHLAKGDQAGVIGTKLPTGELVAKEVLLGLVADKSGAAAKADAKTGADHKH